MEKRARGEIRVHERKDGQVTYSLRFRVNGKREILTLGTDTDGLDVPKGRAQARGRARQDPSRRLGTSRPAGSRRRSSPDVPCVRVAVVGGAEGRAPAAHSRELRVAAAQAPAAVLLRLRDLGDRRRARRALPRAQGHRARAGSRGDRRRRAATGQARTAARSAEQREHQQDARHAHADPRQCGRARPPGVEPGSRASGAGSRSSNQCGGSSRPTTSRSCSRSPARWTGTSTEVTGSVGGR